MPNAPPIVQYWHSEQRPAEVERLVATFRLRNPDFTHVLLDEASAEKLIAAHFTPREVAAFRSCAVPAMQADYLRYCAVYALGGIYADVDFACRRPLRELLGRSEGGLLFRRTPPGYLLNGFFLFAAPGHPLLRLAIDVSTANIERRVSEKVQMVTGPWIFSGLAELHRLGRSQLDGGASQAGLESLMAPFRRAAAAQIPSPGARLEIDKMARALFEAVGDYDRVAEAFGGVEIAPVDLAMRWIEEPRGELAYRAGDEHWINWQSRGSSIFR